MGHLTQVAWVKCYTQKPGHSSKNESRRILGCRKPPMPAARTSRPPPSSLSSRSSTVLRLFLMGLCPFRVLISLGFCTESRFGLECCTRTPLGLPLSMLSKLPFPRASVSRQPFLHRCSSCLRVLCDQRPHWPHPPLPRGHVDAPRPPAPARGCNLPGHVLATAMAKLLDLLGLPRLFWGLSQVGSKERDLFP